MKYSFILFLFFPICFLAQTNASKKEELKREIEKFKKDPDLKHATWGLYAVELGSDIVIAEHNSDMCLIPASTLKTLTTGAALGILGTSYKFETKLEYDGYIDSATGTLHGNTYINGSGDPTLESEYFKSRNGIIEKWVVALQQKGIKKIEGAIVADASLFEEEAIPSTWIWGDIGNYYGSGAYGLNFIDNKYTIYYKSGANNGDGTAITRISPEIPGLLLKNHVTTGGSDDNAYVYGGPYTYDRFVKGTIPAGKTNYEVDGSIPDPAWFCAYALEQKIKSSGIEISQKASTTRGDEIKSSDRKTIYSSFSPSLDSIVYYTNVRSNNLYAESLLKTIAAKKNKIGTEIGGIEEIENYWRSKGIDMSGLYMNDGCGLSRSNAITAKQQALILKSISKEPYYKKFYTSLPIAGKSGSLASMCKNTFAENNLRAKSGYINKVRCYTGYVKNRSGHELAFSILVNNYKCSPTEIKKKIERLLVLISEQ